MAMILLYLGKPPERTALSQWLALGIPLTYTPFLYRSCWWFLSTAFPMIAGTLGPVASAFSICSLAEPWRQQLVPGGDIQDASSVPDPSWYALAGFRSV